MLDSFYYNDSAVQTLVTLIDGGRFPHALMIEGADGSGKTHFARIAAAAVVCRGEKKPCGVCSACVKVSKDIHPDVMIIEGGGGARSFHIDAVRELKVSAYVKPSEADKKVYILRSAHEMTVPAQNAILKIIEEPPSQTVFILTAAHRSKLLPTIASRTVIIPLRVPSVSECAAALETIRPGGGKNAYEMAAIAAGGRIGEALRFLDDPGMTAVYEDGRRLAELLFCSDFFSFAVLLAKYEKDRAKFLKVLDALESAVVQTALYKSGGMSMDHKIKAFSGGVPAGRALKAAAAVGKAKQNALQNANLTLLSADLCVRLKASES